LSRRRPPQNQRRTPQQKRMPLSTRQNQRPKRNLKRSPPSRQLQTLAPMHLPPMAAQRRSRHRRTENPKKHHRIPRARPPTAPLLPTRLRQTPLSPRTTVPHRQQRRLRQPRRLPRRKSLKFLPIAKRSPAISTRITPTASVCTRRPAGISSKIGRAHV